MSLESVFFKWQLFLSYCQIQITVTMCKALPPRAGVGGATRHVSNQQLQKWWKLLTLRHPQPSYTLLKKFNSHLIKCICQFYIPEYMGISVPYKSCQSNDRRGGIEPGGEGVVPLSMLTMFSPPSSICPTSLPQTPELWMWDRYDHSISQEKKQMFKEIVT